MNTMTTATTTTRGRRDASDGNWTAAQNGVPKQDGAAAWTAHPHDAAPTQTGRTAVDPVTVEIIRNALVAATDEMSVNLARSAYTPIIYEMKDYSVAIFDSQCRLLGQSPGLPIFLGALEDAVRVTLDHYGREQMSAGDVYLINDSYLVGSHLNDVSLFSPIFYEKSLVGFAATKAHWIDIGSKDASQSMSSTNIFQEGYRIGPTRILRRNKLNEELLSLFMLNSRMPRSVRGDFYAQVAACRTGEQRIASLLDRFGTEVFGLAVEEIFEQCERLDRQFVAALPDGSWEASGFMDSDGNSHEPVKVNVRVTITGSDLHIDLAGSSPQTGGCLNSGFAQTVSAARLAFKFLVNPDIPATGGTFRCLHVSAPEGTIFSAKAPAACQYYYPHSGLMIDLFIKLMGEVLPERVTAAQCADPMNVMFDGVHPDSGEQWVVGEATAIGWGASRERDGENGLANYGGGDLKNYPVEVLEAKYPVRVDAYGLEPDTGGPGRRRGGLAIFREFTSLADCWLSLWLERTVTGPWGIFGGAQGGTPHATLRRPDGSVAHMTKCSHEFFAPGSSLRVVTGGGGGYGDPAQREHELVAADLEDGYVTAGAAAAQYGGNRS
jgi:N-methylhydantoinase B